MNIFFLMTLLVYLISATIRSFTPEKFRKSTMYHSLTILNLIASVLVIIGLLINRFLYHDPIVLSGNIFCFLVLILYLCVFMFLNVYELKHWNDETEETIEKEESEEDEETN